MCACYGTRGSAHTYVHKTLILCSNNVKNTLFLTQREPRKCMKLRRQIDRAPFCARPMRRINIVHGAMLDGVPDELSPIIHSDATSRLVESGRVWGGSFYDHMFMMPPPHTLLIIRPPHKVWTTRFVLYGKFPRRNFQHPKMQNTIAATFLSTP